MYKRILIPVENSPADQAILDHIQPLARMTGARLVTTAMYQLAATRGRYALCTMCIGVGQGIATVIERC